MHTQLVCFVLALSQLALAEDRLIGTQVVNARIPFVHGTSSAMLGEHDGHEHAPSLGSTSLVCNCSFPASLHCSFDGLCDAAHVALHLRDEIRTARRTLAALAQSPGDAKSEAWRRRACGKIQRGRNVTDLLLLEYETWEPACLRLSESLHTCGMGPSTTSRGVRLSSDGYIVFSADAVNRKLRALAELLNCKGPIDRVEEPVYICQSGDHCNSVTPTPLVRAAGSGLFSGASPTLIYVLVPLAVLVLILLIIVAFCCIRRQSIWTAKLKVSERQTNNKYYDDVDITDIMPPQLPCKDIVNPSGL